MSELPSNFDPTEDDIQEVEQSGDDWFLQRVDKIRRRVEEQREGLTRRAEDAETESLVLQTDNEMLRATLKGKGAEQSEVDRSNIERLIPHRRPFMFLEDAKVIEPGKRAIGILADLREPDFDFLRGHFPEFQVVPGVILTEALAELATIAYTSGFNTSTDKIGVLVEDKMRYKQMVRPGNIVRLEAEITNIRRSIGFSNVRAIKDDVIAAEGTITFALVDKPQS